MTRIWVATAYAFTAFLTIPAGGQTLVDLKNQSRNVDFTSAASTKPFRAGTDLPAVCSIGEAFFKTNADPGRNWYACTAANTWTLESGGIDAMGGDLAGAPSAATVERIQGRRVANAAPAEGHVLYWNAGAGQWEPRASGASGGANVSYSFTGQTAITIPGATHGLGTANLIVACYDGTDGRVEPGAVVVDPANYDVTVRFITAQSGRCVINGAGGGGGVSATENNVFAGGTTQTFLGALIASDSERTAPAKAGTALPATCGAGEQFFKKDAPAGQNLYFCTATNTWTQMRGGDVTSVFGRTGAVAAQAGDYTFPQIAGTVVDAQIAAGVNAAKIGGGGVTNTQFDHLANVTSDIQTQLDGKAAASHGHSTGGDLTGDVGSATVTRIQSRAVASAAPSDGQALVWNATGNTWQPGTVSGGGGGGMASLLGDFGVSRTSATTLSVGANCTTATPCNARFGNVVYQFTRGCTATLTAGTGSAYIYVGSGGVLTVGHNLTVATTAGCMSQGSVTSFPDDSIPLFAWSATSGAWDDAGGRDFRGWLSQRSISAGTGIATVESGGRTTVAVDAALVPTFLTATATIDLPPIAAGACASDYTIPLTGAVAGDAIAPGWPGAWQAGLSGTMRVSASNTIAVRVCNTSTAAIDPVSAMYRATIVRGF